MWKWIDWGLRQSGKPGQRRWNWSPPGRSERNWNPPGWSGRDWSPPGRSKWNWSPPGRSGRNWSPPGRSGRDWSPPGRSRRPPGGSRRPPWRSRRDGRPTQGSRLSRKPWQRPRSRESRDRQHRQCIHGLRDRGREHKLINRLAD